MTSERRKTVRGNGNDNGNGKNIFTYFIVFETKYTLLHLICLFQFPLSFKQPLTRIQSANSSKTLQITSNELTVSVVMHRKMMQITLQFQQLRHCTTLKSI